MGFKNSVKWALCVGLSLWLALAAGVASACSVPVFRYALERWPTDLYRVVVFHKGELSKADQAVVDWLKTVGTPEEGYERLLLRTVDLEGEVDEQMQSLWEEQTEGKEQAEPKLPWMVVLYPPMARIPVPAWSGPVSADAAKRLVRSPAREKVAERILGGDSVVWVFLESGNKKEDAAARKALKAELAKLEKDLEIPEQAAPGPAPGQPPAPGGGPPPPGAAEVYADDPAAVGPELKVAFSVLSVKRSDPKEQSFIEMLLHTEKGLAELDEPMAFAFYGRGRALWALVGEGINEQNIFETSAFLVGPCSCQVKAQAPGTDILMLTDWDGALMGEEMVEEELPPLIGVPETVALAEEAPPKEAAEAQTAEGETAAKAAAAAEAPTKEGPVPQEAETAISPLVRNVAIALGAALAVLGVATAVVVRRNRNGSQE